MSDKLTKALNIVRLNSFGNNKILVTFDSLRDNVLYLTEGNANPSAAILSHNKSTTLAGNYPVVLSSTESPYTTTYTVQIWARIVLISQMPFTASVVES